MMAVMASWVVEISSQLNLTFTSSGRTKGSKYISTSPNSSLSVCFCKVSEISDAIKILLFRNNVFPNPKRFWESWFPLMMNTGIFRSLTEVKKASKTPTASAGGMDLSYISEMRTIHRERIQMIQYLI